MTEAAHSSNHVLDRTRTVSLKVLGIFDSIPSWLIGVLARVSVATVFWRSARTKVDGFEITQSAYFLFKNEYRVPLIPYDLAAVITTISEHLFAALLMIGLASRLSALGLLVMTLVIQIFIYPQAWPTHIFWITALVYIIARGPGVVSVDHFIRRTILKS